MNIKCKFCDCEFIDLKKFEGHLIQAHREIDNSEKLKEFKKTKKDIYSNQALTISNKKSKKELRRQPKKIKQIYLKITISSKRGIKVRENTYCSSCKKNYSIVWKYNETNIGVAFLCYSCKNRILKTSNRLTIIYSNPESNRKKY